MNQDSNPDLILNCTFTSLCHDVDLPAHFFPFPPVHTISTYLVRIKCRVTNSLIALSVSDQSSLQFFERTHRTPRKENANKEKFLRVKFLECKYKDSALNRRQNISLQNWNEHRSRLAVASTEWNEHTILSFLFAQLPYRCLLLAARDSNFWLGGEARAYTSVTEMTRNSTSRETSRSSWDVRTEVS